MSGSIWPCKKHNDRKGPAQKVTTNGSKLRIIASFERESS